MRNIKFSIVIPTFLRADLLERCLDSIKRQNYDNYEVIVVDNEVEASEEVKQLLTSKYNERYHYAHQVVRGVSAARNKGIEQARGEWVLFVDDDDEIESTMLFQLDKHLQNNKDISFTWSGVLKLFESSDGAEHVTRKFYVSETDLEDMSFIIKIGTGCGLCVRKSDLVEIGCFDEGMRLSEDRDLLIKLIKANKKYKPLNKTLYKRYYHIGERLSQSLHALEEAEHDYRLYYEHLNFITRYPVLRLRLLDLRARHYFDGGEIEKAIDVAFHAWQVDRTRVRGIRRLASFWLKSKLHLHPDTVNMA